MIELLRTDSSNAAFIELVRQLDADLAARDGKDHLFYAQFNRIEKLRHVVVAYDNKKAVGCGAMKEQGAGKMEVKRMYTMPESRKKGVASAILKELENWAVESAMQRCILETGKRQPEAIALYLSNGYKQIPNYGQYVGIENSVCFEKPLK